MKGFIKEFLPFVFASIALCVSAYLLFGTEQEKVKAYDCSISEISPDYPLDVKEACRRLRMDKYGKSA